MALNLRVRGPEGQVTLKVEPSATAAEFRQLLADKTGVPADRQEARPCTVGTTRCNAASLVQQQLDPT